MTGAPPMVVVVDDDESVRESLPDLLREFGFRAEAFASAEAFLTSGRLDDADCLILDIAMPGMSGPELQLELKRRGSSVPVIFITAHGADVSCPRLIKLGAVDCLSKPFTEAALLKALSAAMPL